MKKVLVILFASFSILSAQDNLGLFKNLNYGFYAGFNSEKFSEMGGIFSVELSNDLNKDVRLKLATGYYKAMQPYSRIVRGNGKAEIEGKTYYFASEYELTRRNYDVFPFALGAQYFFSDTRLSPYLSLDLSYNYISTKLDKTGGYVMLYSSYEDIPNEFKKTNNYEELPTGSLGVTMGIGTEINISQKIALDLRYFYKYDTEIIETHQIIFGINF